MSKISCYLLLLDRHSNGFPRFWLVSNRMVFTTTVYEGSHELGQLTSLNFDLLEIGNNCRLYVRGPFSAKTHRFANVQSISRLSAPIEYWNWIWFHLSVSRCEIVARRNENAPTSSVALLHLKLMAGFQFNVCTLFRLMKHKSTWLTFSTAFVFN